MASDFQGPQILHVLFRLAFPDINVVYL